MCSLPPAGWKWYTARNSPGMLTEEGTGRTVLMAVAGAAVCIALVWGGLHWRDAMSSVESGADVEQLTGKHKGATAPVIQPTLSHPFVETLKLICAALVAMMVTAVHQRYHGEKPLPRSIQHAQVLICIIGALIMIIISNSLARAFGIAGATGIVRFRTPVEDAKDSTVLVLLIALGMACGLGAFAVAGLGTVFVCTMLVVLEKFGEVRRRTVLLSMTAPGKEFPTDEVNRILGASVDFFEQREIVQGNEALMRYQVTLDPNASLTYLTQELMKAGLKGVSWGEPGEKKKEKGA